MGLLARLRAAANAFMGAPVPGEISRAEDESSGQVTDESGVSGLKREIDSTEELTPERIREYFVGVGRQLEEYYETLKRGLRKAQVVIEQLNGEMGELQAQGAGKTETVSRMQSERDRLRSSALKLESMIEEHRERLETIAEGVPEWSFLNDPEVYRDVNNLWISFRDVLGRTESVDTLVYDASGLEIYFRDVFPVWKGALPLWKKPEPEDNESRSEERSGDLSSSRGTKRRPKAGGDPYQQLTQELIDALRMTTRPGDTGVEKDGE